MKYSKEKQSNISGITLISLVVTIVVLIILAGISIGMLTGDNGIIKNAGSAKEQSEISEYCNSHNTSNKQK